ncbi:MAG TPA: hypothetical protein VG347_02255 [Verrucomicrobiae bacterium]|nr:hypothetical protein [Verrucomicrobiae bacterium]
MARTVTLVAAAALFTQRAGATPYAGSLTNNNGTIQFYLNEAGSTVLVTYEDGSTNSILNGVTSINVPAGLTNFLLGAHTSYAVTVTKVGSGTPSLIKSVALSGSTVNPRGIDVNKNTASPYFGRVYEVSGGGTPPGMILLNPDLSFTFGSATARNGGLTFGASGTGTGQSPYRLWVSPDDSIIVGDATTGGSAVYQIDPNVSTNTFNKLILGPVGNTAGLAAGSHGTVESRPLLIGSTNGGNAVLWQIDGDISPPNSLLSYNIGSGPYPWTNPPSLVGPNIGISLTSTALGGNEYPGLTRGPNGYLYTSTYRNDFSRPVIQVYDATGTNILWNSWTPDQTPYNVPGTANGTPSGDYFVKNIAGTSEGIADSAVSADGSYLVAMNLHNGIVVCALTNGIPNPATIFTVAGTGTTSSARGVAWDAALNYYLSSSGLGVVQEWSLGVTAKAVTTGNVSGQTNFGLTLPSTKVSVTATTPFASQAGPTPGVFTITRSSAVSADTNASLTVFFSIGGTATTNFTVSGATTYSGGITNVTFAPGQNSTNIIINPTVDSISRPTTTVTLTLVGSGAYGVVSPLSDTVSIQNTGPQLVFISSALGSTMYKGLTNDFCSFILTRWGDTNAPSYLVTNFIYSGVAQSNVQFTAAQGITINPGDITDTNASIFPLIDTTNYVGNKTFTVGLNSATGQYTAGTNKANFTIIDNVRLPAAVLWANPLTDPNDVTNWGVTAANNNMHTNGIDNTIEFGYDLTSNNGESANNGLIPLPPSGASNCLRVTVNKSTGAASGVNLYPTNVTFSGDYAFRFAMDITEGNSAAFTTEGALFGINHGGTYTNWWSGSGLLSGWDPSGTNETWSSDGIWYTIITDGGASAGDYIEKTGVGGTNGNSGWQTITTASHTTFANVFKNPSPYSVLNGTVAIPGLPSNISPFNQMILGNPYTNAWANVEVKTVKNLVTMSINGTTIMTYTNTTVWTNGTIMLGYLDPFSSVGGLDAAVYFSDLKVVRLAAPQVFLQPSNIVAAAGALTNFSVGVNFDSSSANTNGQWLFNNAPITGATNTTYNFTVVTASYGTYAYTVNDGNYAVTSSPATLRPPLFTITTNPVANLNTLATSLVVAAGISTNLYSAATSFSGVTNYQWQVNSANIPNATSRTYSFIAGPTNYGTFRVIVNDNWNFVTSSVAVVTPPLPSIISVTPSTRAAAPGTSPTFTVVASTFSGLTNYQWLSNSISLNGNITNVLTLTNIQPAAFGSFYTVRVGDGTTFVTNATPLTVTVAVPQTITAPALLSGGKFRLSLNTEFGPAYVVDSKTNLLQSTWLPLSTNAGTGSPINVTNTVSANQGYFRIRLQ